MDKRFTILLIISIFSFIGSSSVRPSPADVPDVSAVYNKTWYSGYLDFTFMNLPTHMHYFHFPSQSSNPEKDPILFWFNGGPGCSSLLGALYEHGPFIFNDGFGFLMNNIEAWNKRANTVYIESPAQVGFSYMEIPQDQKYPGWNDNNVAKLNLQAVLQFFKVFNEYQGRSTFISGESYGGIYVPTLANQIHEYNNNPTESFKINFKGFAVGNGCADPLQCQFLSDYPRYQMELFRDLGFINDTEFKNVSNVCEKNETSDECLNKVDLIEQKIDGINIYDAYRPCWQTKNDNLTFTQKLRLALRKRKNSNDKLTFSPPCVDAIGIDKLLKDKDNRKRLGIPDNVAEYSMCNGDQDFDYTRSTTGTYSIYKKLIPLNKYKIVIYSGDTDPAVPISGTLAWIQKIKGELALLTKKYWRPWMTKTTDGFQNSGSVWQLSNKFTLIRFKGVGHMAPQWNNQGGTKLINNFLFDEEL